MTRLWLVLGCVAALLALTGLMGLGWRNRAHRQVELEAPPEAPERLGEPLAGGGGLYVGTTYADKWQDRIVAHGLGSRAAGSLVVYRSGVVIERNGESTLYVPFSAVVDVRLAPGLANKVIGSDGLFVVRWRLGDVEVDSGFRADDRVAYETWMQLIKERANV